jgi:hypothetical protein
VRELTWLRDTAGGAEVAFDAAVGGFRNGAGDVLGLGMRRIGLQIVTQAGKTQRRLVTQGSDQFPVQGRLGLEQAHDPAQLILMAGYDRKFYMTGVRRGFQQNEGRKLSYTLTSRLRRPPWKLFLTIILRNKSLLIS